MRARAELRLATLLESEVRGFAQPIILTDPDGFVSASPLSGHGQDIGLLIDPGTGQSVSGRTSTATLRISSILAAGYSSIPEGIADNAIKPWRVTMDDVNGVSYEFKVDSTMPDRTAGVIVLELGIYEP